MSIKARAYSSKGEQLDVLWMHCGHARFVFNLGLEQRSWWSPTRRHFAQKVTTASQMRELTEARAAVDWLREGSTVVQQGVLRDLERAFANFFEKRSGYPRFKKRADRQSFIIRDVSLRKINKRWGEVLVPKGGYLKFRITKPWMELRTAKSARVVHEHGRWTISFTTAPRERIETVSNKVVGIDRGVANSIATSDGALLHAPSLTVSEQKRFHALEHKLAKQVKGSKNREKTKAKLGRMRVRLADRRTDWTEQNTTSLALAYDGASIENLRIANMTAKVKPKPDPDNLGEFLPNGAAAKSGLNRAILASCWGKFAQRLSDKMIVVKVSAQHTSQQCSLCKHIAPENRKSQAEFVCVACGHEHHADINAAINIRDRGFPKHQPEDIGGLAAQHATTCEAATRKHREVPESYATT